MEELQVIETTSGRQFKPWASREDVQAAVQDPASITAIASEIASGKQAIAEAINAKGGEASATESFTELAQAVADIPNLDYMARLAGIIAGGNYNKNILQGHNENVKYGKTEIVDNLGAFETINVNYCFAFWDLLERVEMPSLATISADRVFYYDTALQEIDMPNLTIISGGYAFYECHIIHSVNLNALTILSGSGCFYRCYSIAEIYLPNLILIQGSNTFQEMTSLKRCYLPLLTQITRDQTFRDTDKIEDIILGRLTTLIEPFYNAKPNIRNITIGQDTNINLPFQNWTATNVIAEGQSGIDELNSNLYNNLLTKLYDHSQDGQTRTLRIGWLARVTAENIAYANAKGWTLTT